MPSPGEDLQSWSVTAIDNGSADPLIVWSEGQARASVNNSSRGEMAAHAKNRNLLNGSIVTTGTPNAQQFLSGVTYTTIPTGLIVKIRIGGGLTNTGPTTLNMDGIGAVTIKTPDGTDILGGELVANCYTDLIYNGTNWIFLYSHDYIMERLSGGGGVIIGKQIFSTPGAFTYTPTPGTECCIVECIGAGGGGGGGFAPGGWGQGAPGGGGGGYSRSILTAAQIGLSQAVAVGSPGSGGSPVGPQAGAAGGATSFGTLVVANGGGGGAGAYGVAGSTGGAGGAVGTGDIAAAGSCGEAGHAVASVSYSFATGGSGGPGPFGGRGTSFDVNGAAGGAFVDAPASGYGGGGGGGIGWHGNTSGGIGGRGAGGICIVTEFAGRGGPGRDGAPGPSGPQGPAGAAGSGTGDVLVSGTPAAGQIAEWVDTSHIRGIAAPTGFTTGDVKMTLKAVADTGWVMMNDGTIGNTASGATTRANGDCQNLFVLLWTNIADAWAPVSSGRGANALADFTANKTLKLPRTLGRSLSDAGAGAGLTACALGQFDGAETHVLSVAELASHVHLMGDHVHGVFDHSHLGPSGYNYLITDGSSVGIEPGGAPIYSSTISTISGGTTAPLATGAMSAGTNTGANGGDAAIDMRHPRAFLNVMIKL